MKNLFINKTANADKFGKMVDRIGEISEVDKKFIRKSCERVINEWEERNKKDFSTLFHVTERDKHDELHKITEAFQRSLSEKIESTLVLKKIGTIAEFWLEDLFYPF
ncbi:MAG: hypothetical protein DRO88_13585 [Promethearchaeia archaeon]|nr:MAG: hypothetical protein DRO88_13585 [Candidatus Lokiarchaeia archaeon]